MNKFAYYTKLAITFLIKVVVFLVLLGALCCIVVHCIKPFFLTEDECKAAKSMLIVTGMGALGTCCTVWLALMTVYWRRILERPKLKMAINSGLPYCMLLPDERNELSGRKTAIVEICGKIVNGNRNVATDCKVICKGVYVYSPDQRTVMELKKLRPVAFPWVDSQIGSERMDISRSLDRYFKFAEISYPPQEMKNGEQIIESRADGDSMRGDVGCAEQSGQGASIVVFIPGDEGLGAKYRLPVNTRSVLLHVAVACVENPAKVCGIRIDWYGNDPSEYSKPGMFFLQQIGEFELTNLIGEIK